MKQPIIHLIKEFKYPSRMITTCGKDLKFDLKRGTRRTEFVTCKSCKSRLYFTQKRHEEEAHANIFR